MSEQKNNSLQNAKNKRTLYLFFATFFFSMFLVGFIIKALSPSVDVEIGDEVETNQDSGESTSSDQSAGGNVDNRLKWIQFEDNMPGVSKRLDANVPGAEEPTLENKNNNANIQQNPDNSLTQQIKDSKQNQYKVQKLEPPLPSSSEVARNAGTQSQIRVSKVYVGYYTSIDQAISVQNKLIDSDLNVSPFVKEVNGYYVVQVGSFANRQKAQQLHGEVSAMGLPAKIVSE